MQDTLRLNRSRGLLHSDVESFPREGLRRANSAHGVLGWYVRLDFLLHRLRMVSSCRSMICCRVSRSSKSCLANLRAFLLTSSGDEKEEGIGMPGGIFRKRLDIFMCGCTLHRKWGIWSLRA